MKKLIAFLLVLVMIMALFAGCAKKEESPSTTTTVVPTTTAEPTTTGGTETVEVMTHDEFDAAAIDSAVVVECYIAAVESWYNGVCHIYALAEDGGYYIYNYACTQEEADALTVGTKIRVSGYKAEWSGEVEIVDATIEKLEADATYFGADDVTELFGTDELIDCMNDLVAFQNLTVAASTDANGNEAAFLYKWDGSGSQGDDLYFNVTDGTTTYTFTVNVYMIGTGADSDVYKAVEALQIGDVINIEGFLYWYNNAQTHVTSVTSVAMTHEEFAAANVDDAVTVVCTVAAVESWYNGACHIYALAKDGGYYIYSYACTQEEADVLVPGTKILVSGYKAEWSGEVEIVDASIQILGTDNTAYTADDVTDLIGKEALADKMNDLVVFKGLTVAASTDANGNETAFLYKWDGSGSQGDDLYFNVTDGTTTYTFTVNVYMIGTGADSDVYKAVEGLKIGETVDVTGFLYWYNNAQTHVTDVSIIGAG